MVVKSIGISKLAEILDCSISSIYSHIGRKNWDAVPKPMYRGRRLAWLQCDVDEWLLNKAGRAQEERSSVTAPYEKAVRIGRPTKTESVQKKRGMHHA